MRLLTNTPIFCLAYFLFKPHFIQAHLKTHAADKPHKCTFDGCGRQFSAHCSLKVCRVVENFKFIKNVQYQFINNFLVNNTNSYSIISILALTRKICGILSKNLQKLALFKY